MNAPRVAAPSPGPRRYQRLSLGEVVGRGVVASIAGGLMAVGAYPMLPALLAARARRQSLISRALSRDLALEWSLGVASCVARPFGLAGLPGAKVDGPRPIILAHGYAMGRSCFIPMAMRLAARGLGPIVGFEYWSLGSIADAAKRLGRVVERVLEATGAGEVDIVGHSMGGVVSRYYVNLEGGSGHVRRLITLGSPHAGAEVSLFGAGQMRRELSPGSATLARLSASRSPADVALTLISSPIDVLVGGSRHNKIEGAEVLRFTDVGHMALLTDRRVFAEIVQRLAA